MIEIDGCMGEGGGQVLRIALALSMALGKPFHISGIRGKRSKPGLKRQHLACVKAAAAICSAKILGAEVNSTELTFLPGKVKAGEYRFEIGSGGSCCLVLQAVMPPLLVADAPSKLTVTGGTHVPMAPVFDFFQQTLLPCLEKMGPKLTTSINRPGFMQIGGGTVTAEIRPAEKLAPLDKCVSGEILSLKGSIISYNLDESIIERETVTLQSGFLPKLSELDIEMKSSRLTGRGNVVMLELTTTSGTTVASAVAQRGLAAEKVAASAMNRMNKFIRANVPVDVHLADQLIVPLTLAGGGRFLTEKPSLHTTTALAVVAMFTDIKSEIIQINPQAWEISIGLK